MSDDVERANNSSKKDKSLSKGSKCKIILAVGIIGLVMILLLLPLLITSFYYVPYDQYAFKKYKLKAVELDYVYTQGRYYFGPNYELVMLPSTIQVIDITSPVFSSLGLEFDVHLVVYYQLPKENLGEIYNQFSLNYENRITNIAKTTIKDSATAFSVNDYVINRTKVESIFSNRVHAELTTSIGIDIPALYFRLLDIKFPDSVVSSSLASAIAYQTNQIKNYEQDVAVIQADTNNQVAAIIIQTNFTIHAANISANQLISNSISQANSIVLAARGQGIESVLELLNITTPTMRNEFIRLTSILDSTDPKILSGINNALISV